MPILHRPACDTIERIRQWLRRTIVTFTDPISRLSFAEASPCKHARHTAHALQQRLGLLPTPKTVLSDNGSEFEGDFAQLLPQRSIQRWDT